MILPPCEALIVFGDANGLLKKAGILPEIFPREEARPQTGGPHLQVVSTASEVA
jgi:hypothetical protein